MGVGYPDYKREVSDHVLNDFNDDEKENMGLVIQNITDSLSILIKKELELFSSKVNQK